MLGGSLERPRRRPRSPRSGAVSPRLERSVSAVLKANEATVEGIGG